MPYTTHFKRTPWYMEEARRILYARFEEAYWPAVEEALNGALESHSVVVIAEEQQLAAITLVCPPTMGSRSRYGLRGAPPLEIAFVATDPAWEGRGFARRMLSEVLLSCTTTQQGCWLHVDYGNVRAHRLYASLGFHDAERMPDPFGSFGTLMVWLPPRTWENTGVPEGTTLLNARPCETEETLRRGVFAPPRVTCT